MFRFASPYFLILLFFIPVLVYYRYKRGANPSLKVSDTPPSLSGSFFVHTRHVVPFLKYAALVLMIVALARPQWGTKHTMVQTEGINIILAVDVSGSMAALDFKRDGKIVNRLEAVKGVINNFIAKRDGDRIGMVIFGTTAFTQIPLTRDYNTISYILDNLDIGAAGKKTAIGDAIGISLKRLKDIKSKSNIIILLTDGESNAGELEPEVATSIALEQKVKIYTVGVGSNGKAPFLVNDPLFGQRYVYQRVNIDEDTLRYIADKTDGHYFNAKDTEGLKQIYETINKLETTEHKVKSWAEYKEYYSYLLFASMLVLILSVILENTRYLRVP